ncbi:UNVERIFIED_CONTAM: hypothetical protein FKN15_055237 [Acipenser sinensis]
MYAYSRDYGLGAKDEDSALRCMSVLNNLADQLYYPCEHLAWAADAKVISTQSGKWWTLSTALWGISLLLGIMRFVALLFLQVRMLCYGSQLAGGVLCQKVSGRSELGKSLLVFSAQLSQCRTVLRLFDDLSMYAYSRDYGLGAKDEDSALRCMSVLNNLADQLYYPCEHLAWAADAKGSVAPGTMEDEPQRKTIASRNLGVGSQSLGEEARTDETGSPLPEAPPAAEENSADSLPNDLCNPAGDTEESYSFSLIEPPPLD